MCGLTYSVLLIPPQDYLRHPHPTRLHYIFENFDDSFRVTILNIRLRKGSRKRESKHEIIDLGRGRGGLMESYLLTYGFFHLELARLIKERNYDCVVLSHIISPLVPLLVRGRPLVFDYKDVYSESASAPFQFPVRQVVYWAARFFEELLFRSHMTVVVPSPSIHAVLRSRYGLDSYVITNGVNTELFRPLSLQESTATRAKFGVHRDDFLLVYLGSIESWIDLEPVLTALESFPRGRLILVGGPVRSAEYMEDVLSLCKRKGLANRVTATGFQSQFEAGKIVSASDAAIIPFRTDTRLSLFALPDKLFEYLAAGVPVVSTRLPDVARMFGNSVRFYDDVEDLLMIFRTLMETRGERIDHAGGPFMRNYDWRVLSQRYQQLLRILIENRGGQSHHAELWPTRVSKSLLGIDNPRPYGR